MVTEKFENYLEITLKKCYNVTTIPGLIYFHKKKTEITIKSSSTHFLALYYNLITCVNTWKSTSAVETSFFLTSNK